MSRLVWGIPGNKRFEVGVSKGVLYVDGVDGVAWNGLISVSESPSGGDPTAYYVDGIKFLTVMSAEEFEATLDAFTYPTEFEQCDGTQGISSGLYATQQPKKPFGLSYQSKVGNDLQGLDHGYKIHLVYGASASPTTRNRATTNDNVDPLNFSWKIVTTPSNVPGIRPTAHFVIDSRETPPSLLQQITDILYGTVETSPRLPGVDELLFLFQQYAANVIDAKDIANPEGVFATDDAGDVSDPATTTLDGGTP